eukprot:jgi/Psemu1/57869/gm1.57869_g
MVSVGMDLLDLPKVPLNAQEWQKFQEVEVPLVYAPKLCQHGCSVKFSGTRATITNAAGHILLISTNNSAQNLLYVVPLHRSTIRISTQPPRVAPRGLPPGDTPPTVAPKSPNGYLRVLLVVPKSPNESPRVLLGTAGTMVRVQSAYEIQSVKHTYL